MRKVHEINELKRMLDEEITKANNTLTSSKILEISRKLDRLIVEYHKEKLCRI